jgi:hypothetical protein
MAARQICMARVTLSKQAADGRAEEVGEVLFSRIPVRSEGDYSSILNDILNLQQAKELSEDIRQHQNQPHGKAAGYTWQR